MSLIRYFRRHYSFILQYLINIFDKYKRANKKKDGEK